MDQREKFYRMLEKDGRLGMKEVRKAAHSAPDPSMREDAREALKQFQVDRQWEHDRQTFWLSIFSLGISFCAVLIAVFKP